MIWVLIDGKRESQDIARAIKKTKRAVDKFFQSLETAGLLEERVYGKLPLKAVDFVPPSWVELTSIAITTEQAITAPMPSEQKESPQEADTSG